MRQPHLRVGREADRTKRTKTFKHYTTHSKQYLPHHAQKTILRSMQRRCTNHVLVQGSMVCQHRSSSTAAAGAAGMTCIIHHRLNVGIEQHRFEFRHLLLLIACSVVLPFLLLLRVFLVIDTNGSGVQHKRRFASICRQRYFGMILLLCGRFEWFFLHDTITG